MRKPGKSYHLNAVSPIAAEYSGSGAVEDQVAVEIRIKRYRRITAEGRDLIVEVRADSPLKSEHPEIVLLELIFIDPRRRIDRNARELKDLRLIRIRPNLEMVHVRTGDQTEPRGRAQKIRKISEPLALVGLVVNRRRPRRRRLDTAGGAEVLAGHEIAELADRAAVLEARLYRRALPAVEFDIAAVFQQSVLGLDVDDAGGAQSKLGRKRAGQQAYALRKARADYLAETR